MRNIGLQLEDVIPNGCVSFSSACLPNQGCHPVIAVFVIEVPAGISNSMDYDGYADPKNGSLPLRTV
jgi:hypothetical protein